MTNTVSLTLQSVSYQLPDGSLLFDDLDAVFDAGPTGLVGRNGIGKSLLARILAGELAPSAGRCLRTGSVHYLAQRISPQPHESVADLLGVRAALDALQRIEAGSSRAEDFDALAERWDLRQRVAQELTGLGFDDLRTDLPATRLSGGEAARVALAGAFLSGADFLILDEPSNHLDRHHRALLMQRLRSWSGGLIVVSHDRALLETMAVIVELSSLGLQRYGGGYGFYAQASARQREQAQQRLDQLKAERRREERALAEQRERQQRRQARGQRQAAEANQAPILLGRQRERSEATGGRQQLRQQQAREALSQRVREASRQIDEQSSIVLMSPQRSSASPERIALLSAAQLPHLRGEITLSLRRGQRIGLVGANGSGKSTLLRLLAGDIGPDGGTRELFVRSALLDQRLSLLDPQRSLLQQMNVANADEGVLRSRLALLGLDAGRVSLPTRLLSGGERIKAALALALYTEEPAGLLLLDEPDNHLDLASLQALETMLCQYDGTLVVVSHDMIFLDNLRLTHRLQPDADGWSLSPW